MHGHQQWTAVYVGSLAARMTTTGDGDSWKRRRSGCNRKDTMAPGRAGIGRWAQLTWNRCVPETAASVGLTALVWRAHTEKIDISVWRWHWERLCRTSLSFNRIRLLHLALIFNTADSPLLGWKLFTNTFCTLSLTLKDIFKKRFILRMWTACLSTNWCKLNKWNKNL